jgi:hypothetical protein
MAGISADRSCSSGARLELEHEHEHDFGRRGLGASVRKTASHCLSALSGLLSMAASLRTEATISLLAWNSSTSPRARFWEWFRERVPALPSSVGDVLGCFPGGTSETPAACFLVSLSSQSTSVFGHQSTTEDEDDEDYGGCVKRRTTPEQSSGVSGLLF